MPTPLRAQHAAMPVIGFLSSLSAADAPRIMAAFRDGLADSGYAEGRNLTIEYRWAEGQYDRLGALAADLARREVAMIAAVSGTPAALAAKAATTTIPIVFAMGSDPVPAGLVTSLSRPGGNVTGVTFFTAVVGAKRLELLLALAPKSQTIAMLDNPNNPPNVTEGKNALSAAQSRGRQASIFGASTSDQIDAAFAAIVQQGFGALYVSSDPLFFNLRSKLVALAARHAVPAIYADREFADAGGLISYGASRTDAYRQAGKYAGRILKGDKVGDLPVVLPTKFELVINLKTAKALGLDLPATLLVLADDVIE
ncbi:MAG TPA: ABC transporter substrate-binding protein [Bradyrhizobium sp.]|nr:ABC transporter substrate-binding protein [Bradyrhizobium sp.]